MPVTPRAIPRALLLLLAIFWVGFSATKADAMLAPPGSNPNAPARSALAAADLTPPSSISGMTMTGATPTSITLGWNAATDDVGVAGYRLYRGGTAAGTTQQTSYAFTGLACGTSYVLAVETYDAAGNVSNRAEATTTRSTAACPAADTTPPSNPQGYTMTGATQTSITMQWTAATDNVAVTGYRLFRNGTASGTTATTSRATTGLTCGTSYVIALEAYDAAGNVSDRAAATTTRSTTACAADTTAPSAPGAFTMTSAAQTSITMQWTAATDNVAVAGYRVFRDGVAAGTTQQTSYALAGLVCGRSYVLAVEAYDAAGNASSRPTSTRSTTACATPTPSPTPTPTPTPQPPPAGAGHLFVDTNGGSCTRQATPGAYSDAAACGTFNAAFQAASPGDVVRVRVGSYGDQGFSARTNTGAQIQFRADGGIVRFGTVNMNGADRITFYGPYAGAGVKANSCGSAPSQCLLSRNIVWVGLTLDRAFANDKVVDLLGAAVGWTFRDFNICCGRNDKLVNVDNYYGSDGSNPNGLQGNQSTDIVFEYGSVHSQVVDVNGGSGSDVHTECFWLLGPQSFVMRGVHSYGCNGTMNMNYSATGDALIPANLTIESSIFEPAMNDDGQDTGCVAQIGTGDGLAGRTIIRNNIFQASFCVANQGPTRDGVFANNVGAGPGCGLPGFTYVKNRWSGAACSASDVSDGSSMQTGYYADAPKSDAQRSNTAAGSQVKGNWAYTGSGPHIAGGDALTCAPWSMAKTRRPAGSCDQGAQQFSGTSGVGVGTANFTKSGSTFDAGASVDPDGTITEYRWTFNGAGVNTPSPTLTRTVATGDLVTLAVVDNAGNVSGLKTIKVM